MKKNIDGELGTQTRDHRMEGAHKSTEPWRLARCKVDETKKMPLMGRI